jgi:hypothetical protein
LHVSAVDIAGGSIASKPVVTATSDLANFVDAPSNPDSSTAELSEHFQPARIGYRKKRKSAGGLLP